MVKERLIFVVHVSWQVLTETEEPWIERGLFPYQVSWCTWIKSDAEPFVVFWFRISKHCLFSFVWVSVNAAAAAALAVIVASRVCYFVGLFESCHDASHAGDIL